MPDYVVKVIDRFSNDVVGDPINTNASSPEKAESNASFVVAESEYNSRSGGKEFVSLWQKYIKHRDAKNHRLANKYKSIAMGKIHDKFKFLAVESKPAVQESPAKPESEEQLELFPEPPPDMRALQAWVSKNCKFAQGSDLEYPPVPDISEEIERDDLASIRQIEQNDIEDAVSKLLEGLEDPLKNLNGHSFVSLREWGGAATMFHTALNLDSPVFCLIRVVANHPTEGNISVEISTADEFHGPGTPGSKARIQEELLTNPSAGQVLDRVDEMISEAEEKKSQEGQEFFSSLVEMHEEWYRANRLQEKFSGKAEDARLAAVKKASSLALDSGKELSRGLGDWLKVHEDYRKNWSDIIKSVEDVKLRLDKSLQKLASIDFDSLQGPEGHEDYRAVREREVMIDRFQDKMRDAVKDVSLALNVTHKNGIVSRALGITQDMLDDLSNLDLGDIDWQTKKYLSWVRRNCKFSKKDYTIEPSQGDGWKISTPHGYIDYRHEDGVNEVWWVESDQRGHGSELVDLMQENHPAEAIAWGATSQSGEGLMKKWHRLNPDVECITGVHEGQFDPFGNDDDFDDEGEIETAFGTGGSNNGGSMSLDEKNQIEIGILRMQSWTRNTCKFANRYFATEKDLNEWVSDNPETHHHIRSTCESCGNVTTCRCSSEKENVRVGRCHGCEDES
jgi:hypothetical protein